MPHCAVLFLLFALSGCATSFRDRKWLDRELHARAGTSTRTGDELPEGVSIEDGIDEADVVSISLWQSPALRAELTRIDTAFATLHEARRPANPQLSLMGPIGPVTAVATLLIPLESLWQMPNRANAAAHEADVTGESVLMRALDLVRDARLLHVDLGLATDRALIRAQLARVAIEIARIASVRASVGDISPLEEQVLSADARASADASDLAETEVSMARARLAAALAIDETPRSPLRASFAVDISSPTGLRELIALARAARPDARSAELAISAATARAKWERSRIFNLSALVEAQWHQPAGPGLRLGGRAELPIFNQNQGGIGRADAEVERAKAQHDVVARSTILEVTIAHTRFVQATRSFERFEAEVLPALDVAQKIATHGFETGDETYLVVLDVLRRVDEARLRRAELLAERRRALCDLERAIGARLENASAVATRAREERGKP